MSSCPDILLVEDDEDDYVLVREMLVDIFGHEPNLEWVTTVEAALARVELGVHDICLVDFRLGQRNGLDLVREAIASGCHVPFILLTGQHSRELDLEAMRAGATDYLVKSQIATPLLERSIRYAIERSKAERELLLAKKQAEDANRAKTDFLASMSHEIRTPMNGVLGAANVLLGSELSPHQRQYVDIIKESGEALLSLLNDILDLSKVEAGHVELELLDFDLRKLLAFMETMWRSRIEAKGLEFSVEIASDIVPVLKSDPTRIRQIIVNLLGNATKFTQTGGITIGVSQRRLSDVELETRIEVADTGIGITPEARPLIFSKFTQADGSTTRKFGGTGLGLAISKQLSELLGGEIGFDTTEGAGSTFWFNIRCAPGDAITANTDVFASEIDALQHAEPVRPLNILVAEDNKVNQAVIRGLLEKAGHRVDIVGDGVEAISAVMRVSYDLVLMDVQMPQMDGMTATRKIRDLPGKAGNLPIIALTANAMKGDRENCISAGMTDYVPKPISPIELMAAIARSDAGAGSVDDDRDPASEEQPLVDELPVLDRDVLDTLSDGVGEEYLPELIKHSVDDMRTSVGCIVELGNGADFATLRREAHDLKSGSGGLGAVRLQRHAQALELACREDREDDARHLLTEIEPIAREAFDALTAEYDVRSADAETDARAVTG